MKETERKKKILITSYRYLPETTPRAFRTFELVKELSQRGYLIDLYLPNNSKDTEYTTDENCFYYFVNSDKRNQSNRNNLSLNHNKEKKTTNFFLKVSKKLLRYILGGDPKGLIYGFNMLNKLLKNSSNKEYDLIISIGLPFYIHFATAIFIKKSRQKSINVCDYGDPFYLNPAHRKIFILKYFEKWSINQFDFISIPTAKSINYYTPFKDKTKIKVIPQGFDFSKVIIEGYQKNTLPTFCYAGIFYKNIRDPEYLFEFLASLNMDFRFVIYTRVNDQFFHEIFAKYNEKLGSKITLLDFIPREELIKKMSKMDFLINMENTNSNQVPSKIIDYSLSKRPILSINKDTFDKKVFLDFLNGNYKESLEINIADYNIKQVVNQFLELSK
jgi:hypothetical protein